MRHSLTLTSADGTEVITLQVPTSWMDVTLQQYIDWQVSELPAVCVLSGITPEQLDRLAWKDAGYLMNLLSFAAETPEPPVSPDLKDPGAASYGQFVLATQYIEENPGKPDIWYAPYLYALYQCRAVYGRNDQGKEKAMMEAILQEPVGQCLSNVLFFWASWAISMNSTSPKMTTTPSPKTKNWRQVLRNWVNGSASPSPSTALPLPGA